VRNSASMTLYARCTRARVGPKSACWCHCSSGGSQPTARSAVRYMEDCGPASMSRHGWHCSAWASRFAEHQRCVVCGGPGREEGNACVKVRGGQGHERTRARGHASFALTCGETRARLCTCALVPHFVSLHGMRGVLQPVVHHVSDSVRDKLACVRLDTCARDPCRNSTKHTCKNGIGIPSFLLCNCTATPTR